MYNISTTTCEVKAMDNKTEKSVNNIKKYRLAAGMKQIELCRIVGITQGALSGWENGRYEPDIKSLNKMADLFHTTIDDLMGIESNSTPRTPTDKEIQYALFGEEVTDEMYQEAKEYAQFLLAFRKNKKEN